jgi:hypothetical protein
MSKIEKMENKLKDLVSPDQVWVHPNVEWKQEVNADDTLLGYEDWLKMRIKIAEGV